MSISVGSIGGGMTFEVAKDTTPFHRTRHGEGLEELRIRD